MSGCSLYGDDHRGGYGGGAIRLISPSCTVDGTVEAAGAIGFNYNGWCGNGQGGGAGGSILLECATLAGASTGKISVRGGDCTHANGGSGAGGRIAVYYDSTTYAGSFVTSGGSVGAVGGGGTLYLKNRVSGYQKLAGSVDTWSGPSVVVAPGVDAWDSLDNIETRRELYFPDPNDTVTIRNNSVLVGDGNVNAVVCVAGRLDATAVTSLAAVGLCSRLSGQVLLAQPLVSVQGSVPMYVYDASGSMLCEAMQLGGSAKLSFSGTFNVTTLTVNGSATVTANTPLKATSIILSTSGTVTVNKDLGADTVYASGSGQLHLYSTVAMSQLYVWDTAQVHAHEGCRSRDQGNVTFVMDVISVRNTSKLYLYSGE